MEEAGSHRTRIDRLEIEPHHRLHRRARLVEPLGRRLRGAAASGSTGMKASGALNVTRTGGRPSRRREEGRHGPVHRRRRARVQAAHRVDHQGRARDVSRHRPSTGSVSSIRALRACWPPAPARAAAPPRRSRLRAWRPWRMIGEKHRGKTVRKFLIILDDTPEMLNAMRYAAIRAAKTGGALEILAIISSEDFQTFMGVADVMRAEAREKIEAHFEVFKDRLERREGVTPTLAIREGDKVEAVLQHIASDPEIAVLVLGGASADKSGPDPLIGALTGRRMAEVGIPITIVPGSMTKEQILAAS